MARRTCFLSYSRRDDEPFVERLRDFLEESGVSVWWDRTQMQARGMPFLHVIDDAIREVDRVVYVVGTAALASQYVHQELDVAEETCKVVIAVLRSTDPETVKTAVQREHVYDLSELDFSRPTSAEQHTLSGLVSELSSEPAPAASLHGVPALPAPLDRRPEEVERIVAALLVDLTTTVVMSTGMGGLGKSVLAGLVAHSCKIRRAFGGGVLFARSAPESAPVAIVNDLLRAAEKLPPDTGNLRDSQRALREALGKKPYLLVVDNVWNQEQVEAVANAAQGSRAGLLLTTRVRNVAEGSAHRSFEVQSLTPQQSRAHLAAWVGSRVEDLPAEADTIVERCGGLLLALTLCGAFLKKDHNTWSQLAEALAAYDFADLNQKPLNYEHRGVLAAMAVSFEALRSRSPILAERYLLLATFDTSRSVPIEMVAVLWERPEATTEVRRELSELHEWSLLTLSKHHEHVLHDALRAFLLAKGPGVPTLRRRFLSLFEAQGGLFEAARRHAWLRQVLVEYLVTSNKWEALEGLFNQMSSTGENAWYSLRIASDELAQYVVDLERISTGCARLDAPAQVRWLTSVALTQASLSNRSRNTPPELMCSAVKHGLWSLERATAALGLATSEDRAMGLAGLLGLHPPADRGRAVVEFFEALEMCDAGRRKWAVARFRREVDDWDRALVREPALAFLRDTASTEVLDELLGLFTAADLPRLSSIENFSRPEERAALTRLMHVDEARSELSRLCEGADLSTRLSLYSRASVEREVLTGEELQELTVALLKRVEDVAPLMQLLAVASEPHLRRVAPLLTADGWTRLFGWASDLQARQLTRELTAPLLYPGLREFHERHRSPGWRAANLARLASTMTGPDRTELLRLVERDLANELSESEGRLNFSGLSDTMSDLTRVWHDLAPRTRAALLAGIARIRTEYRGEAIAPLFAVEASAASRLARELLSSLRNVQAFHEAREPISDLAPYLLRADVAYALALSEGVRDAGHEFEYAENLWSELAEHDRASAHAWLLQQSAAHLNAPGSIGESQFSRTMRGLSTAALLPAETRTRARELTLAIKGQRSAAVCFACLASWSNGEAAEEDWRTAESRCEKVEPLGAKAVTYAAFATLAPEPKRTRFCEFALSIETELSGRENPRDSWQWRADIIAELPDSDAASDRALKMLGELYADKVDTYASRLLPKCKAAALVQHEVFKGRQLGRETIRALVRRLCREGMIHDALRAARSNDFPDETLDDLAPALSLQDVRTLLTTKPNQPALLERLAGHGYLDEALEAAERLKGVERFVAVARCCKHAKASVVGPVLEALADLEPSSSLHTALRTGVETLKRLPEPARLTACRSILELVGKQPRQIAIPSVHLLAPLLVSFDESATSEAAGAIFKVVRNVTGWWPAYPRLASGDT